MESAKELARLAKEAKDVETSRFWINKWFPPEAPLQTTAPQENAVVAISSFPHDSEQAKLSPAVFREMRHSLGIKPSADVFASATHHQLPRYYPKEPDDVSSAGVDAFAFDWKCEGAHISIPTGR